MKENKVIFNFWVNLNYKKLALRLKGMNLFNEDVYHNTLIDMFQMDLSGKNTTSLDRIFYELYEYNLKKDYSYRMQYVLYEIDILEFIANSRLEDDDEVISLKDAKDVIREIKNLLYAYPADEARMFFIHLENPSLSTKELSMYSGLCQSHVHEKLNSMKSYIVENISLTRV